MQVMVDGVTKSITLDEKNYETPADQSGDDRVFHEAGIPNLWYYDINPFHQLHTPCDTLDTIDFGKMTEGVIDAIDIFKQLECK